MIITEFAPAHAAAVLEVVRAVYNEYGFTWDDSAYFDDLRSVHEHYTGRGGMFWVLLADTRVVGTVGVSIHGDECELHRLYLLKEHRGTGCGRRLLHRAIDWARQRGKQRMIAWSDVSLTTAHALYRREGFVHQGERICDDPDLSREFGFRLELS